VEFYKQFEPEPERSFPAPAPKDSKLSREFEKSVKIISVLENSDQY